MEGTATRPMRPGRGLSSIRREITVRLPLEETFAFFCDARNLEMLTPEWLSFRLLTPAPIDMRRGTVIDYRIRIHGFPVRWRTEITEWDPPHRFIDLQLRGPYRWWHHEHRFEPCGEGTRIIDEVEYRAPLRWISHALFVRRDVERIFDYRAQALGRMFGMTSACRDDAASPSPSSVPSVNPNRCRELGFAMKRRGAAGPGNDSEERVGRVGAAGCAGARTSMTRAEACARA